MERPGWLLQIVFHIGSRHGEKKPYAIWCDHDNVGIANKNVGRWLRVCCERYTCGVFCTNTAPCDKRQSVTQNNLQLRFRIRRDYDVIGG